MERSTLQFLRFFARAFPGRSVAIVGLMIVASFAEGIGIISLLPLLEVAAGGAGPPSALGSRVAAALDALGVAPTHPNLLALIVLGITLKSVLLWVAMRQVGFTVAHVAAELRLRFIRTLLRARWGYFVEQSKGHLAAAVSAEAQRASAAYREACTAIAHVFQMAVYVGISILISWQATLAAVVGGGLFLILLRRFVEVSRTAGRQQTERTRALSAGFIEALQGIKPIKAMALEDQVLPLLERETEGIYAAQRVQVEAAVTLRLFQDPVVALFLAVGLGVALSRGGIPLPMLLLMAVVFYRLMTQLNMLQRRMQVIVTGETAFWALHEQLEEVEAAAEDFTGQAAPERLVEGIRLEGVSFGYEGEPLLHDVDLDVPVGAFVALVGESGAGKTTLADLILGLHRPHAGEVNLDGVPLSSIDVAAWRRRVGYVPQDTFLFHDTVLRNVTLGDPALSRDDAEEALRAAEAWAFIEEREGGLDAPVGEEGGRLSGGQRQRIAIARALVRRPLLLVLDEATTALDPATESAIGETLGRLKGRVTILSISHQTAMTEVADIVYTVGGGAVKRA